MTFITLVASFRFLLILNTFPHAHTHFKYKTWHTIVRNNGSFRPTFEFSMYKNENYGQHLLSHNLDFPLLRKIKILKEVIGKISWKVTNKNKIYRVKFCYCA